MLPFLAFVFPFGSHIFALKAHIIQLIMKHNIHNLSACKLCTLHDYIAPHSKDRRASSCVWNNRCSDALCRLPVLLRNRKYLPSYPVIVYSAVQPLPLLVSIRQWSPMDHPPGKIAFFSISLIFQFSFLFDSRSGSFPLFLILWSSKSCVTF